jgi:magnesium transporter
VPIKRLLFAKDKQLMKDLMTQNFSYVCPDTYEDKVADLVIKKNIKAIPVIKNGEFLGVVLNDKIMTILKNDFSRNLTSLSGVNEDALDYRSADNMPFFNSIKNRLPWLLIGLFGITLSAGFINIFEELLSEHLIIAFFIPAIVYMSGAIGSQHQTLLIRDLALSKEIDYKKYFLKVIATGGILGIIIGFLVFIIIQTFWGDFFSSLAISLAMGITLIVSSASSFIITYIISKTKNDPAEGSGPFATIISDVTSIMIYFLIVSFLLNI